MNGERHPYGHSYPNLNHITEADLFRGYSGLSRRTELARAELVAKLDGQPVPERLLERGRRCPCGGGK